ncbi:MAG: J domain-containing protein [Candidatus Dormiibacterota bacterium]
MRYSDGADDNQLYALLGVSMTASMGDLKQGRRTQAQKWHPDRSQDPAAQQRMAAINNAYRILSDPEGRKEYDESILSAWQRGTPATTATAHPQPGEEAPAAGPAPATGNGRAHCAPHGTVTAAGDLREKGFSVVDNRRTGGVLWVVAKPGLEQELDGLREQGMEFEFASRGGMATNNKPAWFSRSWG